MKRRGHSVSDGDESLASVGRASHPSIPRASVTRAAACAAAALLIPLAAASITVPGCGSARRDEPLVGPVYFSMEGTDAAQAAQVERGREVFARHCYQCHPGGAAGLAPAINDKPLPEAMIKFQVRNGLGAMPAFDEERISDADLDAVVAYLDALRANR